MRRSRVVERLIDEWLAAHPEHPPLLHLEDAVGSAVTAETAQANATIETADPGTVVDDADRQEVDEPAAAS
jgi:hypothetical protein